MNLRLKLSTYKKNITKEPFIVLENLADQHEKIMQQNSTLKISKEIYNRFIKYSLLKVS